MEEERKRKDHLSRNERGKIVWGERKRKDYLRRNEWRKIVGGGKKKKGLSEEK